MDLTTIEKSPSIFTFFLIILIIVGLSILAAYLLVIYGQGPFNAYLKVQIEEVLRSGVTGTVG